MKFIKIDPQERTVEYVEGTGELEDIYRILGCRLIDTCARQDNGDALTVDDEALFLEPQPAAFTYNGFGRIHGVALLMGSDSEGDMTEPATRLDEVNGLIEWLGEVETEPFIDVIEL